MAKKALSNTIKSDTDQFNFKDDFELIEWVRNNYLAKPDECYNLLIDLNSTEPFILANKSNLIGIILFFRCDYYKAFELFKEAIAISRLNDLKEMETKLLVNLTSSYIRFNKYKEALELAFESLKYKFDKYNAMTYHNLAIIYDYYGEEKKSFEAKLKCKSLNEKIGEKKMIINDYYNIGDTYYNNKKYKKAIIEYKEIIEIAKKTELNNVFCGAYASLAPCFIGLGQYEKAITSADKGLKWGYKYDNKRDIALCALWKADALINIENYIEAENSLNIFFKYFKYDLIKIIQQGFDLKIKITEKLYPENLKDVYKEYNEYLIDEMYKSNEEGINDILQFKEQEIDAVQKKNKAIEIQNRELSTISKLLAHDLKTPIRTIGSFSNLLNKKFEDSNDDEVVEFTKYISDGSREIYDKLDLTEAYLNYTLVKPLKEIDVTRIIEKLKIDSEKQKLSLKIKGKPPIVKSNKRAIYDLFHLLIKFVLKHNIKTKKEITFNFIDDKLDHLLIISDNGNGLKNAAYWFNEFFNQNKIESSGIEMGFALVRKIVMIHNGDVLLDAEDKNAVKLKIWLPKNPELN